MPLCLLAPHAAPQMAAASSGPFVPNCVRLRCCCAWLWLVGGPLRGAFVCSVLAVALQVRAAPLCPLAVCQAPETAAASSGPFVPTCVLWWSCCCAASRCRPISILGKQQAKVIRHCRPNQPYAETLRGAGEPAHAKRRSNSDCDVAAASVCAMANWQRHGRAACKREWCGCVSAVAFKKICKEMAWGWGPATAQVLAAATT